MAIITMAYRSWCSPGIPSGTLPSADRFLGSDEEAAASAKRAAGDRIVLLHGGSAAVAFLSAGLVDELALTIAPVVLGAGRRLFDASVEESLALTLVRSVQGSGALRLRYRVDGAPGWARSSDSGEWRTYRGREPVSP